MPPIHRFGPPGPGGRVIVAGAAGLLAGVLACPTPAGADDVSLAHLLASDFAVHDRLADIPGDVLDALRARLVADRRIADRNEPFNRHDVVEREDWPSRRLRFAAVAEPLWLVYYESGGRVYQRILVMVERLDGGARVLGAVGFPVGAETLDDLRRAAEAGSVSDLSERARERGLW